jgi:folate-binding protein YgfZ
MIDMEPLALHEFHDGLNAHFAEVSGKEVVSDYGDILAEHRALRETVGVIDLSLRSRLCVLGVDRQKFINGQVTNNVQTLKPGEGVYAALVTAKGRIQSDLNIYSLANELLLDFEPGLSDAIKERLEKYVIADDVQIVDVAPHYGLLSVQGPKAAAVIESLQLGLTIPTKAYALSSVQDGNLGEIYLMNVPRLGTTGFDLFVPSGAIAAVSDKTIAAAKGLGGCACGWQAFEIARIEAGIPRFGVDMDETNLAPEAIESRAISYSKGCYIGQEVIARIRTYGQVTKSLCGLRLADDLKTLPAKGDKLVKDGKELGYITSATHSPKLNANIALGYVRKEANKTGEQLMVNGSTATIVDLPFIALESKF